MNSSPSQQDLVDEYLANRNYMSANSVAKCYRFIEACIGLGGMHPSTWQQGQQSIVFDTKAWLEQQKTAESWLAQNLSSAAAAKVKLSSFADFRN